MRVINQVMLAIALSGGLTIPTSAQTERIALASHAGRVAEVGANFGIPPARSEHLIDSMVCQNDTIMMVYGRYRSVPYDAGKDELKKKSWKPSNYLREYYSGKYHQQAWEAAVAELRRSSPEAKLIDFDKQQKKHGSRKPAGHIQTFPKRPLQYSYWREMACAAALGAVGWLLGRKPEAKIR